MKASRPQGMILAAGYGKRLFPLTHFMAKPAVPFLNRPIIRYSLDALIEAGVSDIHVNLHHRPESVREALRDSPARIHFSEEPRILGTSGALAAVRDRLETDTLVVSNGKIYFEQDLREALEDHRESGAWVTLLLRPYPPGADFNPVFLDSDDRVTGFGTPCPGRGTQRPCVFTGVHILQREVLERIGDGVSDSVKDLYPRLIDEGRAVRGFLSSAYWCECSVLHRYLNKSIEVLRLRGLDNLGVPPGPYRCRDVILGDGATLGRGSRLGKCILWDGVQVASDAVLENVVVTRNVSLPRGTNLKNAIVTPVFQNTAVPAPRQLDGNLVWTIKKKKISTLPPSKG